MPSPKSNSNKIDVAKRKLFQYSPHKITLTLNAIKNGMPVSTASRDFNVPRTTLRHKISGKAPETSGHVGPQAVLGSEIENELVVWIKDCARAGFPINKEGLLDSVKKIVVKGQINTPFINNRPSRSWFDGFMARHPDLRQKHAEYINKARALITEEKIRNWFKEISSLLGDDNLMILEDPSRVWNCDETAFFLAPKGTLVLAEKGQHVYDTSKNSDKENITTLFTVNAAGEYAPPLTIFKYKRMSTEVLDNAPNGWGVGKTDKGWMTGESFYEYVANVFIPYLKEKEIELPVILFLDGHKSHLTMQLSELCRENGIIVIALVPNTTHMLQPLDVAVFYPLKQNWRQLVKKWRIENDGQEITKFILPSALQSLLLDNKDKFAKNVKAGFQTCGLYPFGAEFVNYKRIIKNSDPKTTENRREITISESSYISYLESKIDSNLLKDFYISFNSGKDWEGKKEATMLYDIWLAFKNENTDTMSLPILASRNSENAVKEIPSPSLLDISRDQTYIDNVTDIEDNSCNTSLVEREILEEPGPSSAHPVTCVQDSPRCGHHKDTLNKNMSSNNVAICNQQDITAVDTDENKCKSTSTHVVHQTARDLVKDCVLYPGKVIPKNTRKAIYVPSVITSDKWRDIMKAAEKEKTEEKSKKSKQAEKIKPKKKKVTRIISSSDDSSEGGHTESEWNDLSDSNSEKMKKGNKMLKKDLKQRKRKRSETNTSSESELPLNQLANSVNTKKCDENLKVGSYVIIKYEGEYFPGRVENKDRGSYEISTMVLSTKNTFRWPEKADKIWYKINDIVEIINSPAKLNNRGFFKVTEMEKFLPNIYI
ncbi:hypothetical protein O3G_MSEX005530 [Manduca sexta]|uniref:HTH CENPB-type domain-containing protein n=1 Tax=Manduca sexta TaxID=7130 RepID=A0A921Z0L2_MANSE|nr:hypothetical protein O3G_MSEX005530 [Manduca sexta]